MLSRLSGEEVAGEEEEGQVGLILGTCAALAVVAAGIITGIRIQEIQTKCSTENSSGDIKFSNLHLVIF